MECPSCNASRESLGIVEQSGDLVTFRCNICDYTYLSWVVWVPNEWEQIEGDFIVTINWENETPSIQEYKALRQLLPFYREMPVTELKNQLRGQRNLQLKNLSWGKAIDLVEQAKQLGLSTTNEYNYAAQALEEFKNLGETGCHCIRCGGNFKFQTTTLEDTLWCECGDFKMTVKRFTNK